MRDFYEKELAKMANQMERKEQELKNKIEAEVSLKLEAERLKIREVPSKSGITSYASQTREETLSPGSTPRAALRAPATRSNKENRYVTVPVSNPCDIKLDTIIGLRNGVTPLLQNSHSNHNN